MTIPADYRRKTLPLMGLLVFALAGCGGDDVNPNDPTDSPEVAYAESIRSEIEGYEYTLTQGEGITALKDEVGYSLESLGEYESAPVGEHQETYKAIYEGVQELQTLLEGSPSQDEVQAKIDELKELTSQLPGAAAAG